MECKLKGFGVTLYQWNALDDNQYLKYQEEEGSSAHTCPYWRIDKNLQSWENKELFSIMWQVFKQIMY